MGRPKALLPIGGTTFIAQICERMLGAGLVELRVVLGRHVDEVIAQLPADERISWVVNHEYDRGQLSSLQAGIRAGDCLDGVMMALVDHPVVAAETYQVLAATTGAIRIPTYRGRRGHPVVWGAAVLNELRSAPLSEGARVVVRHDPSRVVEVGVDDPGILTDVDLPEDHARL